MGDRNVNFLCLVYTLQRRDMYIKGPTIFRGYGPPLPAIKFASREEKADISAIFLQILQKSLLKIAGSYHASIFFASYKTFSSVKFGDLHVHVFIL